MSVGVNLCLKLLDVAKPNRDGQKLVNSEGKATLYDGRNGAPFDSPVTVGYIYIMRISPANTVSSIALFAITPGTGVGKMTLRSAD